MKVLFQDFLSNKALFFDLFDKAARNIVDMATLLVTAVNSEIADERAEMFIHLDKMEHAGDDITHKINLNLDKVIFPPLNRDDIHALAANLDDVADTIREAGSRMHLYGIVDFVPSFKQISSIILKAGVEIQNAVNLLRTAKKPGDIFKICRNIKGYEQQADQVYYLSLAGLFQNEKNAINLIKHREILLSLETSVNECKSTADVLNAILINNL